MPPGEMGQYRLASRAFVPRGQRVGRSEAKGLRLRSFPYSKARLPLTIPLFQLSFSRLFQQVPAKQPKVTLQTPILGWRVAIQPMRSSVVFMSVAQSPDGISRHKPPLKRRLAADPVWMLGRSRILRQDTDSTVLSNCDHRTVGGHSRSPVLHPTAGDKAKPVYRKLSANLDVRA